VDDDEDSTLTAAYSNTAVLDLLLQNWEPDAVVLQEAAVQAAAANIDGAFALLAKQLDRQGIEVDLPHESMLRATQVCHSGRAA
jgi:hypothetical protein